MQKKQKNTWILTLTIALYVLPIYIDLWINGWMRVFSYFAADTFYYLTVARNFGRISIFSFDGEHITNGFHPLWQVMTGYLYRLVDGLKLSEPGVLVAVLTLSMLFIALAIFLLGRAFINFFGQLSAWFLLLPIGTYALLMAPIHPRYGTLWSFTNGMESTPLILMYALLIWLISRPGWLQSGRSAVLTGLTLGVLVLSRLDHVFLLPAIFVAVCLKALVERKFKPVLWISVSGLIAGVIVFGYMLTNQAVLGVWMPVSGAEKTTFPSMYPGKLKLEEISLFLKEIGQPSFGPNIWRYTQIIFPATLAVPVLIAWLIRLVKEKGKNPIATAWIGSSLFVLCLAAYNFLFVPTLDQGHWYFPLSILFMSLCLVEWLGRIQLKTSLARAGSALFLLLVGVAFYTGVYRSDVYNARNVWFYEEAQNLRAHYAGQEIQLLEYDDGIIAYTTGFKSMSALGFCLDPAAQQALHEKQLFNLAYERGYRYIASHYYFRFSKLTRDSTPEEVKAFLTKFGWIGPSEVEGFRFWVDYASADNQFVMIGFEKEP